MCCSISDVGPSGIRRIKDIETKEINKSRSTRPKDNDTPTILIRSLGNRFSELQPQISTNNKNLKPLKVQLRSL